MTGSLTPRKTEQGWVIDMPAEMAEALGVAEESLVVLYSKDGQIQAEILPPPSPELKESVRRIHEKYRETFEELKRLGD